jgi:probable addiction module antidote protein
MLRTSPFEPADYLKTAEARAEYITAALETNDPIFIRDALNVVARSIGMAKVAEQAGVTREGLYKSLGKSGNPEFGTVMSLLPAMNLRLAAQPASRQCRVPSTIKSAHRTSRKKAAKRVKRSK